MWPFRKRQKALTATDRWSIGRRYRAGTPRRTLAEEYDGYDGIEAFLDALVAAAHAHSGELDAKPDAWDSIRTAPAPDVSFPLQSEPQPTYAPPPYWDRPDPSPSPSPSSYESSSSYSSDSGGSSSSSDSGGSGGSGGGGGC